MLYGTRRTQRSKMNEQKVKETIEDLKGLAQLFKNKESSAVKHCNTAIEALEKQIPRKAADVSMVQDEGMVVGFVGRCPNCKEIIDDGTVVCDCGQKLDWSK